MVSAVGRAKSGLWTPPGGIFRARGRTVSLPLLVCALIAAGCGAGKAESAPPETANAAPVTEAASPAQSETEAAPPGALAKDGDAAPQPAQAAPASDKAPAAAPVHDTPPSSQAPRQVDYRVTPEGLIIEVDGVTMKPRAKAVKVKGGFGVEVTVSVTASKLRYLSNPENGPLAFAGNVVTKKDSSRFSDERHGEAVMNIEPGVEKTITRTFPGKEQKPLYWGQVLELEAGLWGLGNDQDRRPLNKLFKLKFEAKDGSAPVISPPMN